MSESGQQYFVYFITAGTGNKKKNLLKIGYAKDPDKRLAQLQTGNPFELSVAGRIPFDSRRKAEEMERLLQYGARRVSKGMQGEWFRIPVGYTELLGRVAVDFRISGLQAGETEKQCIKRLIKRHERKKARKDKRTESPVVA